MSTSRYGRVDWEHEEPTEISVTTSNGITARFFRADWSIKFEDNVLPTSNGGKLSIIPTDDRFDVIPDSLGVGNTTLTCENDVRNDALIIEFDQPVDAMQMTVAAFSQEHSMFQYSLTVFDETGKYLGGDIPVDKFSYLIWVKPPIIPMPGFAEPTPAKWIMLSAWGVNKDLIDVGTWFSGPTSPNVLAVDRIILRKDMSALA